LVLAIAVASMVWNPADVRGAAAEQIERTIGPGSAKQVQGMLRSTQEPGSGGWATTLSLLGLVLGATAALAQLQEALNEAWGVRPRENTSWIRNFLLRRLLSLGLILVIILLLLASAALSTFLAAANTWVTTTLPGGISSQAALLFQWGVDFIVFTVLFAAIFKFLPDARIAWSDVGVGAAVTSLLFILGKFGLGLYLGLKSTQSAYGAVGSIGILLVWIYYSAMILLLGAEFTQVWACRFGKRVRPRRGASVVKTRGGEKPTSAPDKCDES
jgi:membrane protein